MQEISGKLYCPRGPGPDSPFEHVFNGEAKWRSDCTCSYCGSLSPEKLFESIEAGKKLTPTDKNYKVYVGGSKKFYFQHLSDEQKTKFIDLLNAKKIQFEYPGHFYVLPFFIGPK